MKREVGRAGIPRLRSKEASCSAPSPTPNEWQTARQTRFHRPKRTPLRKSDLSPERRWLIEKMQQLGFGRITHLVIANGEPLCNPPPRLYRHRRLTGSNEYRSEIELDDFILKQQVVNLLAELDRSGSGVIAILEVRDGLPYGLALEEADRA